MSAFDFAYGLAQDEAERWRKQQEGAQNDFAPPVSAPMGPAAHHAAYGVTQPNQFHRDLVAAQQRALPQQQNLSNGAELPGSEQIHPLIYHGYQQGTDEQRNARIGSLTKSIQRGKEAMAKEQAGELELGDEHRGRITSALARQQKELANLKNGGTYWVPAPVINPQTRQPERGTLGAADMAGGGGISMSQPPSSFNAPQPDNVSPLDLGITSAPPLSLANQGAPQPAAPSVVPTPQTNFTPVNETAQPLPQPQATMMANGQPVQPTESLPQIYQRALANDDQSSAHTALRMIVQQNNPGLSPDQVEQRTGELEQQRERRRAFQQALALSEQQQSQTAQQKSQASETAFQHQLALQGLKNKGFLDTATLKAKIDATTAAAKLESTNANSQADRDAAARKQAAAIHANSLLSTLKSINARLSIPLSPPDPQNPQASQQEAAQRKSLEDQRASITAQLNALSDQLGKKKMM